MSFSFCLHLIPVFVFKLSFFFFFVDSSFYFLLRLVIFFLSTILYWIKGTDLNRHLVMECYLVEVEKGSQFCL